MTHLSLASSSLRARAHQHEAMDRRVIEHLPDDALKAIFKCVPRRDLRRLALTNAQFSDIIIPMLNAKTNELLQGIPPALELYRRLTSKEVRITIRQLRNEAARLKQECGQLEGEMGCLWQDPLKLYGVELAKKLGDMDASKRIALMESQDLYHRGFDSENAIRMRHFHRESERKEIEALELQSRAHRLRADLHLAEATNSPTSATPHARLAELNLRASNLCKERSGVQTDLLSRHEAYVKYRRACEKLETELDMLRRDASLLIGYSEYAR